MRDALGSVQSVLVLGGTSDIAAATVRALIGRRALRVILAGRDAERLEARATELRADGAGAIETLAFDADDVESHEALVERAFSSGGDIDLVLLAHGMLGSQEELLDDPAGAAALIRTNFGGSASVLLAAAAALRRQGHGTLVVLSSVAGERARRSNFVYGSSKAGLDAFAQGLGDELAADGIGVMVVRPGFVHTKMTAGLDKAPLSTTPDAVAAAIVRGLERGSETVWAPGALRAVMAVLRHLPRAVFRRLDL